MNAGLWLQRAVFEGDSKRDEIESASVSHMWMCEQPLCVTGVRLVTNFYSFVKRKDETQSQRFRVRTIFENLVVSWQAKIAESIRE